MVSLKLNINEAIDTNSIEMEPYDLAQYINYLGFFGKIEENLNLMWKYLDEHKVSLNHIQKEKMNQEEIKPFIERNLEQFKL